MRAFSFPDASCRIKLTTPVQLLDDQRFSWPWRTKAGYFPYAREWNHSSTSDLLKLSRFLRPNNTIHCDDPRQDSSSDSSLWIPINSPERNSRVDASLTVSAVEHWSSPLNQGSSVQSSKEISIFSFLFFLSTVSYVITARIYLRTYVCIIYTRFMRVRMYIHTETKYTL